ncbi:MAG: MgtC/SapB family protein [Methanomassiliicoccales archaeon]|nr:MAG: MgtC/SapB family protein [Methanomassiliicoccales archaeon]
MNQFGFDEELIMDVLKIFIAMICGGIIGFERELKDKPAGLRTNILVSTGSCLFVIFALRAASMFQEEAGRIMGPIITGIGFLGAGTIIRSRGSVRGLTSAATIWVVAGVGMLAGLEQFLFALTISLVGLFILLILPKGEEAISLIGVTDLEYTIITNPTQSAIIRTRQVLKELSINYFKFHVAKDNETYKIKFFAHGRHAELSRLIPRLLELPDVMEARMENPKYSD